MPRRPRIVHPNEPHHITQRGFGRQLLLATLVNIIGTLIIRKLIDIEY